MSGDGNNSSLSLLLSLSIVALLTVGGGWFLLEGDAPPGLATAQSAVNVGGLILATDSVAAETDEAEPASPQQAAPVAQIAADSMAAELQLDADLRKARMAAAADMLAYPEDQSAMFYYNKILQVETSHPLARAELEAVLAKIGRTTANYMEAEDYGAAYKLAVLVARDNPGHSLVRDVTQRLDDLTNTIVEQAIQHAQDGKDDEVIAVMETAENLPGRNQQYFSAVRESIANIQNSRLVEEQSQIEQVRLASVQATTEWVSRVRSAIEEGRLIAPAGESAIDYLAERDPSGDESVELTNELVGALKSTCAAKIESDLQAADELLAVAQRYVGDDADIQTLKQLVDDAYVEKESAKVVTVDRLVRLVATPARYPVRAQERGQTGWVEVLFTVKETGETADIEVRNAEPANLFNAAATTAVEQWVFEPREVRGRVIDQRALARLVFQFDQ